MQLLGCSQGCLSECFCEVVRVFSGYLSECFCEVVRVFSGCLSESVHLR